MGISSPPARIPRSQPTQVPARDPSTKLPGRRLALPYFSCSFLSLFLPCSLPFLLFPFTSLLFSFFLLLLFFFFLKTGVKGESVSFPVPWPHLSWALRERGWSPTTPPPRRMKTRLKRRLRRRQFERTYSHHRTHHTYTHYQLH